MNKTKNNRNIFYNIISSFPSLVVQYIIFLIMVLIFVHLIYTDEGGCTSGGLPLISIIFTSKLNIEISIGVTIIILLPILLIILFLFKKVASYIVTIFYLLMAISLHLFLIYAVPNNIYSFTYCDSIFSNCELIEIIKLFLVLSFLNILVIFSSGKVVRH